MRNGFSVIETLIVAAIVVVIAAIAIPNLLRSKVAGNEASAIGALRNIMSTEAAYRATYGLGYSNDLSSLGGPAAGAQPSCTSSLLLDSVLAENIAGLKTKKSGYQFTFTPGSEAFHPDAAVPPDCTAGKADGYTVQADPVDPGVSGKRHFCADASGVIRVDPQTQVTVTGSVCSSGAPLQ